MARLPGFADIHPLQPVSTVPGALELMAELSRWLMTMTGMAAVALSPKAGAQGELAGMMAIRAAIAAKGETRNVVLVPESAHGTNPATAAALGYKVRSMPQKIHFGDVEMNVMRYNYQYMRTEDGRRPQPTGRPIPRPRRSTVRPAHPAEASPAESRRSATGS